MYPQQNKKLTLLYIFFGILAKIIPHLPGVTPLNNLYLHAGSKLTKGKAVIVVLVSNLLADFALSFFHGYSGFGYWSFFTYSGFAAITLIGTKIKLDSSLTKLIICITSASFIFWIWTNFGCWLTMPDYSKDISGLINCYVKALPFLKNSLLGDLAWSLIVFYHLYKKIFFSNISATVRESTNSK